MRADIAWDYFLFLQEQIKGIIIGAPVGCHPHERNKKDKQHSGVRDRSEIKCDEIKCDYGNNSLSGPSLLTTPGSREAACLITGSELDFQSWTSGGRSWAVTSNCRGCTSRNLPRRSSYLPRRSSFATLAQAPLRCKLT